MTILPTWFVLPFFREAKHNRTIERAVSKTGGNYAPGGHMYAALERTIPANTKVVILGQDPYPTPGHANGFAFAVNRDVKPFPKSLQNIFKELVDDLGVPYPEFGDLRPWADQGVLLLNTCLTCAHFQANSHRGLGWEELAKEVIEHLSQESEHRVFILWGRQAQAFGPLVDRTKHLVIESPHPSPLSAFSGFFGSKPFSRANDYLKEHWGSPINWGLHGSESSRSPRSSS